MQALSADEREAYVRDKGEQREDLERQIGALAAQRSQYLAEQSRDGNGLDAAIVEQIREVAATKGFSF